VKTFAFLFNPVELTHIREFWPITHLLPDFFLPSFLKNQGFKISPLKTFTSKLGKQIQGYFIVSPLLPDKDLAVEEELVLDKIISASYLARDLGADILGLGGYASALAEKKPMLSRHIKTPTTSGSSFTAWSVIEALYCACQAKDIAIKNSTLAIIGAAHTIGSLCAKKLTGSVKKLILCDTNQAKLQMLKDEIVGQGVADIEIASPEKPGIRDAHIVIAAGTDKEYGCDIHTLRPGAIVIDICLFRHFSAKAASRSDISVIEGGLIKLPPQDHAGFTTGLPRNMVCASMAETMLLAFEEKTALAALGLDASVEKLEPLADLAVRHGFQVHLP